MKHKKQKSRLKALSGRVKSALSNILFGLRLTFTGAPIATTVLLAVYLLDRLLPIFEAFALKEIINLIIAGGDFDKLLFWLAAFMLSTVAVHLANNASGYAYNVIEQKVRHRFDNILIDKIVACDLSFFDSSKDQDILKVVRENEWTISNNCWSCVWILTNIISLAASVGILLNLSPLITLLTALCVIPTVVLNQKYYEFIWTYDWNKSKDYRKMYYYYEVLCDSDKAEELRLYNNADYFTKKYFEMWRSWFRDKNKYGIRHNLRLFAANLLQTASIAVAFVFTLFKFAAGKIGAGDIQYYINLTEQIRGSLEGIFKTVGQMQTDSEKITVIRKFLEWQPSVQNGGSLVPPTMPEIEFRNVSFKYPNTERYILKNCSFTIKSGEKIAFVGLNGAGKSTIVKLLLRFYDPDGGEILFDGVNAKEYELKALRRVFGAQFQDFVTYAMSVKENVMLGDIGNEDGARIRESLEFSGADRFVYGYANLSDTQVTRLFDENGEELSGGQKQKIALSRAYYRDADIIILDEPSAALDPEAEHEIFGKFIDMWKGRGAVLISHRLSNVTLCDRIVVLSGCQIVEQGSHAELMRFNGVYAGLFRLQAEKYG